MPSIGAIISSLLVTAVGVAFIFRIDMVRGVVTGISAVEAGKAQPTGARLLYM